MIQTATLTLLVFSWAMLALVIWFTLRTNRLRRSAEQKSSEYERNLKESRDHTFDQQCEMAEKSVHLLELKESLEQEKEKTNALLRNILPVRVIEELQRDGFSRPVLFPDVTVFFSDIVGFTGVCSSMAPEELIAELSDIFTEFDRIFTACGCERIKTIGDAYMAVAGLPEPAADHCARILTAAGRAMAMLKKRNTTAKHVWKMRMGVHSGSVVGGIVGTKRYIYDVFGDTVNTASRMEQFSEPMQINVSESTRKKAPPEFDFTMRPAGEVKGKGVMNMYFFNPKEEIG
ncbi:MAG: adenylate/guanylate cyclase domain-containing protein [Victivallaceae bacterium]|nr:adenylate/guanylate cyclase domain-containing protein [Victivallaceae bacterium]